MIRIDLVAIAAALLGLAAMAATMIVQAQTQGDLKLLANEIVRLKAANATLSEQLSTAVAAAARVQAPAAAVDPAELVALGDRLAAVEETLRDFDAAAAATGAALPTVASTGPISNGDPGSQEECIPPSTQFVVASGDSYAICGTGAKVTVTAIGADQVVLADGGVVNVAGSAAFGDSCRVNVISVSDGFARLRVSC